MVVQHGCGNETFVGLVSQELRWARAVRVVNPLGHFASFVTHPFALALLGAALLGFSQTASLIVVSVLAVRSLLKLQIDSLVGTRTGSLLWLPLRDLLSFAIFLGSMGGNAVEWRGERLRVEKSGLMSQIQG
jgi:ceramide glucosyltransferase